MRAVWGSIVGLVAVHVAVPAAAHIQLSNPPARYVQNDSGLKTSPCGSGTTTGTVTKLIPGQTLSVTWKESVPHAGHFRIAVSAKESDFVAPTSLTVPQPAPAWVLADGIADKTGTQTYAQTVTIPDQECPACVLQLIQVMSSGTDGTNTGSFSGVYYACADLAISSAHADGGSSPDVLAADAANERAADAVEVGARDGAGEGLVDLASAEGPRGGAGGGSTVAGSGGTGSGGGGGHGGNGGNGETTATGTGGSAGGTTGSASSTGGSSARGGNAGGTETTGGRPGSGGVSASSPGGAGGAVAGAGGAAMGGAGASANAPSGTGCACRIGAPGAVAPTWPILGAVALGFAVALRRRHPRPSL